MLRAGHEEGLQCLVDSLMSGSGRDEAIAEVFLVYTATDILSHHTGLVHEKIARKAKAWYEAHKGSEQLRNRIRAVNQSGLSDALIEPLKRWP